VSTEQTYGFFREVYSDQILQGKLNHALAVASPEIVAQIAQAIGYQVSAEDVTTAIGDSDTARDLKNRYDAVAEYVMPRDFWYEFRRSNVWETIEKGDLGVGFNPFRRAGPFRMTIPGPLWVQVMGSEGESPTEAAARPSAVELYDSL
jgi:hypothetical protein